MQIKLMKLKRNQQNSIIIWRCCCYCRFVACVRFLLCVTFKSCSRLLSNVPIEMASTQMRWNEHLALVLSKNFDTSHTFSFKPTEYWTGQMRNTFLSRGLKRHWFSALFIHLRIHLKIDAYNHTMIIKMRTTQTGFISWTLHTSFSDGIW